MRDLLKDLMKVCKVKQYVEIKPYIKDLQQKSKYSRELADKMTKLQFDMTAKSNKVREGLDQLEPAQLKACMRSCWRWIRHIIEDFHSLALE